MIGHCRRPFQWPIAARRPLGPDGRCYSDMPSWQEAVWVRAVRRSCRIIRSRRAWFSASSFQARGLRDRLGAGSPAVPGPSPARGPLSPSGFGYMTLNIHFHSLVLDGLYVRDPSTGHLGFRKASPPSREDLDRVLSTVRRRILTFLRKKGFAVACPEEKGVGTELEHSGEEPSLYDMVQAASVREWIAMSEEARRVEVIGRRARDPAPFPQKPFCANSGDGPSPRRSGRLRPRRRVQSSGGGSARRSLGEGGCGSRPVTGPDWSACAATS